MKKLAYVPEIFIKNKYLSDRVRHFFQEIERSCGFKVNYSERITEEAKTAGLLMVYAGAHGQMLLKDAMNIKGPKKIFLLTGPHALNRVILSRIIDVSSLTLVTYKHYFEKKFPKLASKTVYFPLYFAPHERYARLKVREKPIMKCLLTGHTIPRLYPFRYALKTTIKNNQKYWKYADIMRHPRWARRGRLESYEIGPQLNEDYAKTLNRYFCSIATDSKYRYGLAKYYEIPAAGALLIATRTPDINDAGFKPWVHFVPIEKKDSEKAMNQVIKIIENPSNYEFIRKQGREFVLENHSVKNRVQRFKELLERI